MQRHSEHFAPQSSRELTLLEQCPPPIPLYLDAHYRVNLPERPARLPQLLGMLLLEQQPTADANEGGVANQLAYSGKRPLGMLRAHGGGRFDENRCAANLARRRREPEMPVTKGPAGAVTIRRLGPFLLRGNEIPLDG